MRAATLGRFLKEVLFPPRCLPFRAKRETNSVTKLPQCCAHSHSTRLELEGAQLDVHPPVFREAEGHCKSSCCRNGSGDVSAAGFDGGTYNGKPESTPSGIATA